MDLDGIWYVRSTLKVIGQNYAFSSVGVVTRLRAGQSGSGARFLARAGNCSHHHRVQNCSGAHPASYPMRTRVSFPGPDTEADHSPPSSAEVKD
jgi:hypothetical protein